MRGFLGGIVVGAIVGAGAMFAVLDAREPATEPLLADAGTLVRDAIAAAPRSKAGKAGKAGKRRGRAGRARPRPPDEPPTLSAADRKMIWRGPAVKSPTRSADFTNNGGGRPLDQGEINRGIASARGALTECIVTSRGGAEVSARMKLVFLVNGAGAVGATRVHAPAYLHRNGLLTCVRRALRSASFAATGDATVIRLPFELSF